jgi:hypothetical protein
MLFCLTLKNRNAVSIWFSSGDRYLRPTQRWRIYFCLTLNVKILFLLDSERYRVQNVVLPDSEAENAVSARL